jgi:hypothetical protein
MKRGGYRERRIDREREKGREGDVEREGCTR